MKGKRQHPILTRRREFTVTQCIEYALTKMDMPIIISENCNKINADDSLKPLDTLTALLLIIKR